MYRPWALRQQAGEPFLPQKIPTLGWAVGAYHGNALVRSVLHRAMRSRISYHDEADDGKVSTTAKPTSSSGGGGDATPTAAVADKVDGTSTSLGGQSLWQNKINAKAVVASLG